MKVQLQIERLNECFNNITKIISRKNVFNVYKHVDFVFKDGVLYFYASNGTQHIKIVYGTVEHSENTHYFLEFDLVHKFIKSLDEEVLEFNFSKNKLLIEINKNKYNFSYFLESSFEHTFSSLDGEGTKLFELNSYELSNIIYKLSPCILTEATNSKYKGIYYNGDFVTTDISSCSVVLFKEKIDTGIFIAYEGVNILSNILKSETETVTVYDMPNYIIAKTTDSTFILTKLSTNFPNYKVALSKIEKHDNFFIVDSINFIKICKRMLLFSDTNLVKKICELHIENDVVMLRTNSNSTSEGGKEAESILPTTYVKTTGTVSFLIDIQKVIQYATTAMSEKITISYSLDVGPGSPFAIKGTIDSVTGFENIIHIEGVLTKRKL